MKFFRFCFSTGLIYIIVVSWQILESVNGKVISVTDGDSITLLVSDSSSLKIRLDGIDCPEKNQAFGKEAREFTSSLVFGKMVKLEKKGVDKYGRTLGVIFLNDTINLNKELLKAGLAWHYKQYNAEFELAQLESIARQNKIGLWADSNAIAPWDFRHGVAGKSHVSVVPQDSILIQLGDKELDTSLQVMICMSATSKSFHKYQCSGLSRCKSDMKTVSVGKAQSQGRKLCQICVW